MMNAQEREAKLDEIEDKMKERLHEIRISIAKLRALYLEEIARAESVFSQKTDGIE